MAHTAEAKACKASHSFKETLERISAGACKPRAGSGARAIGVSSDGTEAANEAAADDDASAG